MTNFLEKMYNAYGLGIDCNDLSLVSKCVYRYYKQVIERCGQYQVSMSSEIRGRT